MPAQRTPELLDRLAELPAGHALLEALGDADGVFLVGGAVRDLLRGESPADLDLVTDRDLDELVLGLAPEGSARLHDRFGTASLLLDGRRFDLARARRERYPHPGALPEVEPAPLEEDLRRRDFTVNALALGLGGAGRGELVAVPGGLDDLEAGRLRVLHDDSFRDDPTRLLRLARYAGRLGWAPEPHTAALAGEAVRGGVLDTVSAARLGAELRLLGGEGDPEPGLVWLERLGLGARLLPGFSAPAPGLTARALALLGEDDDRPALALATAVVGADRRALSARLDDLAFPGGTRDAIVAAASGAPSMASRLAEAQQPSAIARTIAGAPPELVALAGALGPAPATETARRWLSELRHVGLAIDGHDLIAAGIAPGPAIGRGLRAALEARLDGRADGRDPQLAVALAAARA